MTAIELDPDNEDQMQALADAYCRASVYPTADAMNVKMSITQAIRALGPPIEPDSDCIVLDDDGDVWTHSSDGWSTSTSEVGRPWEHVISNYAPVRIFRETKP
jgi:hypothetical protein